MFILYHAFISFCTHPLVSTTLASLTPRINHDSTLLFSSLRTQPSHLISPRPPFSLVKYNLSISLRLQCIFLIFLDIRSMLFNSSAVHFRMAAPYLNADTAHVLGSYLCYSNLASKLTSTAFCIRLQTCLSYHFL